MPDRLRGRSWWRSCRAAAGLGAYLNVIALGAGQPNQGLAIVSVRNNTATLAFGGNEVAYSGTTYAARGALAYNDNGGVGTDSLIGVGDLTRVGNPSASVSSYTQAANVSVPSSGLHLTQ